MNTTEDGTTINTRSEKRITSLRNISQVNIKPQINRSITEPKAKQLTEIVCLTSYPPRACGIATYSKDLDRVLTDKFGDTFKLNIRPLETSSSTHKYSESIDGVLNTDSPLDFLQTAYNINSNPLIGLVMVQHEFGLFSQNEKYFYEFLEYLDKPVVITFHTVLPNPTRELKQNVATISSHCAEIIVMTHNSARILTNDYGVPPNKITVIPHGTHLIAYDDKRALKLKYDLEDRTVLSTFGLLGPGKSIETTLEALPKIVEDRPDVIFLIIGRTHPNVVKENGEVYRNLLKRKIDGLGLQNHVRFIDEFVPLNHLLEYLQLTDIYLFTSKDPNQAVSGTFAYALSCGCPIISTPIPHALEVLKNGAGKLFDFENSSQLQQAIIDLLDNEEERFKMSLNGLHTSAATAWENAAIAHAKVFEKALNGSMELKYGKPPINLKHLKNMTTNVGVIQFSLINQPDIESGYTLDDNARALIALCQHYEITGDTSDLKYIKTYFNFIFCCFRHDCKFLNYVNKEYQFTEQNDMVNLEDACGRALWALGYFLSMSRQFPEEFTKLTDKAKFVFEHSAKAMETFQSPRAMAFIIKGLYFYNRFEERDCLNAAVVEFADRLVSKYRDESDENWHWFESYLTYGNSVLPQAMLMAYSLTLKPEYRKIAKASFDFLLSKIFIDGKISVISNKNWHQKGDNFDSQYKGGQQPIDVAYTILALCYFHKVFPLGGYYSLMETAFNWFMGKNALDVIVYNPCTGGCYDGLELENVNLNQGAESAISYLLSRLAFENIDE